jgi:hypothetical protein
MEPDSSRKATRMSTAVPRLGFKPLIGIGVMALIGYLIAVATDKGPPQGPSCMERIQSVIHNGERYSGELRAIRRDCKTDDNGP